MSITYQIGEKDTRPWGTWEVLDVGENYIVKRIQVMPNQTLSLQLHHYRSEHWIITTGSAEVTIGKKMLTAPADTHIFIPVKTKHRIANKTNTPLTFIEIQTGDLLDETDIIRFNDVYGRV